MAKSKSQGYTENWKIENHSHGINYAIAIQVGHDGEEKAGCRARREKVTKKC
jgi:hypothetical protein